MVAQLIRRADLFGIPPHTWWQKMMLRIIGGKTFHWGIFIASEDNDWIVSESIGKGTAITKFGNRTAFVYRMKALNYEPTLGNLIEIHARYGDYPYDWEVNLKTGIWWLLKHYFGKVLPVIHDKEVNCQEWVCLMAKELGIKIIPDDQYPMSVNLENSPQLEYLGVLNR